MNKSLLNLVTPLRGLSAFLGAAMLFSPLFFTLPAHAQSSPRLALVTGSVPLPSADKAYVEKLRKRGWDVTSIDDNKIQANGKNAIRGYDLVVVSSTVDPSRIGKRLHGAPEPILVAEHQLFPAFGLSGSRSGDRGLTPSASKINVVNPSNPMAAGLDGAVQVLTKAKPMNFGKVGSDAYVIATAHRSPGQAVIFAYESGDRLADGEIAGGPRIGFYMGQSLPHLTNSDGWALFDAVAAWAVPGAPKKKTVVSRSYKPIAQRSGAFLGANVSKERASSRYAAVRGFEKQIGRKLNVINRFHEFSSGTTSNFYWDRKHIADGRTVMISWRATDNSGSTRGKPDPRRAKKIVAGQFDAKIKSMAKKLRDLKAPVLLRFNWEMDQKPGDPQYIGTPKEFIAAWRYVHRMFKSVGATNVEWVWAPRARSFAKGIGQKFYPGYRYVDWIGGSAVPINSFTDAKTIYKSWNQWAANIGKPQLLWIGLRENPRDSGWKARFLSELRTLAAGQWSGLKAIVYYNSNSPLGYDYTIDTSSAAATAFRRLGCDSRFTKIHRC